MMSRTGLFRGGNARHDKLDPVIVGPAASRGQVRVRRVHKGLKPHEDTMHQSYQFPNQRFDQ